MPTAQTQLVAFCYCDKILSHFQIGDYSIHRNFPEQVDSLGFALDCPNLDDMVDAGSGKQICLFEVIECADPSFGVGVCELEDRFGPFCVPKIE